MKKDVFNKKGDFITSVEISQMFGEMIGVWILNFLQTIKVFDLNDIDKQKQKQSKKKVSLIEFGPGRGTLMCDILRTLAQFNVLEGIEINFIEFSPFMRKLQQENIIQTLQKYNIYLKYDHDEGEKKKHLERFQSEDPNFYLQVRWFSLYEQLIFEDFGETIFGSNKYKQIDQNCPYIILAHEFFDALPANIFEYSEKLGWCEKLVNICHDPSKQRKFEFMLSEGPNEAVKKILRPNVIFKDYEKSYFKNGDAIEIQPKSLILTNSFSELINKTNGAALIIDYGDNNNFSNSIRGIRNHKFIPDDLILEFPGEIDLSAYVNFEALASVATLVKGIKASKAMPQGLFLESMGLNTRLDLLCQKSSESKVKSLESEYLRLVSPDQMGSVYKCMYLGNERNGEIFPFIQEIEQQIFY